MFFRTLLQIHMPWFILNVFFLTIMKKKSLHRTAVKLDHWEQIGKLSTYSEKKQVKIKKQTNNNHHHPVVTNFLGNISE